MKSTRKLRGAALLLVLALVLGMLPMSALAITDAAAGITVLNAKPNAPGVQGTEYVVVDATGDVSGKVDEIKNAVLSTATNKYYFSNEQDVTKQDEIKQLAQDEYNVLDGNVKFYSPDQVIPASDIQAGSVHYFEKGTYKFSDGTDNPFYSKDVVGIISIAKAPETTTFVRGGAYVYSSYISNAGAATQLAYYVEGIVFDGDNKPSYHDNMKSNNIVSVSGKNIAFRNCSMQNVAEGVKNPAKAKDLGRSRALNIHSASECYFEDITIKNVKTRASYGVIGIVDSSDIGMKGITIDMGDANANAVPIFSERSGKYKDGTTDATYAASNFDIVSLSIKNPQVHGTYKIENDCIMLRSFGTGYAGVPPDDYRYILYSKNRYAMIDTTEAMNLVFALKDYPSSAVLDNFACFDRQEGAWIIDGNSTVLVQTQLASIYAITGAHTQPFLLGGGGAVLQSNLYNVRNAITDLDILPADIWIKYVAPSGSEVIDGVDLSAVPSFITDNAGSINIVPVASVEASIDKPLKLTGVDPKFDNTSTVTAYLYQPEKFTVTFDSDGGTAVDPQEVLDEGEASEPKPAPTKAGHGFMGWYEEGTDGTAAWDFDTQITSDLTLVAKWSTNLVAVTFDPNGGEGDEIVMDVAEGATIETITPPVFTREGYAHVGWELVDGTPWVDASDTVNGPITLNAVWSDRFTVSFDAAGGAPTPGDVTDIPFDIAISEPQAPTRDNFQFMGWYYNGALWNFASDTVTGNMTLVAQWQYAGGPASGSYNVNGSDIPLSGGRTLTDPASKVSVQGILPGNAKLTVSTQNVLHGKDLCPACEEIRRLHEAGKLIALLDISVTNADDVSLHVRIPVGTEHNNKKVTVLHCNKGVLETANTTVESGIAAATFDRLSPFAVTDGVYLAQPNEIPLNPPKTGDQSGMAGILLLLAALCGVALVKKARKA